MRRIVFACMLCLLAVAASADLAQYLIIAMPEAALTPVVQNKLDKAIQRFTLFTNSTDSCGGWTEWCLASNTSKIWMVTSLATEHLQVHVKDKLDEQKLADLNASLADARIKLVLADNIEAACTNAGLRYITTEITTNSP